jgi:hypothetical protein
MIKSVALHVERRTNQEDWIDYNYTLQASDAFWMLKEIEFIPADSILMNVGEEPLSYCA